MTKFTITVFSGLLLVVSCSQRGEAQERPSAARSPTATDSELARSSYALGFLEATSIVREYRLQGKVDPTSAAAGFKASLEGANPRFTKDEMLRAVRVFQTMGWVDKGDVAAIHKQGRDFLTKNRAAPGVVQLPSGVQYRVLKPSQGPRPTSKDSVKIAYSRRILDGPQLDASPEGGPQSIPIARTPRAWRQVLSTMSPASKVEIFIPPGFEFESTGALRPVPPHATIICEVELLEILPPAVTQAPSPAASPSPFGR